MTRTLSPGRGLAAAAVLALVVGLASRPWTVRPIQQAGGDAPASDGRFDAGAFVDSVWTTRVLPAVRSSAVELHASSLPGTGSAGSGMLVRGSGVVVRVDARSRVGLALVDLEPADGRPDVALQVGPVLRGSSLRDALPFIRFGDFANQIDFAEVANALNARILATVLGPGHAASREGRHVTFWGAMTPAGQAPGRLLEIVPVILLEGTP